MCCHRAYAVGAWPWSAIFGHPLHPGIVRYFMMHRSWGLRPLSVSGAGQGSRGAHVFLSLPGSSWPLRRRHGPDPAGHMQVGKFSVRGSCTARSCCHAEAAQLQCNCRRPGGPVRFPVLSIRRAEVRELPSESDRPSPPYGLWGKESGRSVTRFRCRVEGHSSKLYFTVVPASPPPPPHSMLG